MQIHNAAVTGSFTYNGIDISDITGSEQSVVSLNEFSASILNYTSSNNEKIAALNAATASLYAASSSLYNFSASILSYTSSTDDKITQLNRETSSLNFATASINNATASLYNATASINSFSASILNYTASNNDSIAALYTATASLYAATASIYGATSSLFNYSASSNLRIGSLEQYTASLNTRSASFACVTATNNFACTQYFSNTSNAVSFTSTGSLYSDGGVRITRDMYVSGTAFFNNVTVFGTQSVAYISSSQLNIGTNIISVNTDTPSIRFGGLAVYDSGSTGLTGSILWDSEDNQWIYSNPSGSEFDSAVFLVGPRNVGALGNEAGISCNFLSKGNGMHHMTSSAIFENGSVTCIGTGASITSAGAACFAGSLTGAGAAFSGNVNVTVANTPEVLLTHSNTSKTFLMAVDGSNAFFRANSTNNILFQYAGGTTALNINGSTGAACFNNSITACTTLLQVPSTAAVVDILRLNNPAVASSGTRLKFENGYGDLAALRVTHMDNGSLADDGQIEFQTAQNAVLGTRMAIFNTGISCFSCQVCAPSFVLANGNCITALRNTGGAAIGVLGFTSGTDTLFMKGGNSGGAASIQFQDTAGTMATFYNSSLGIGITAPCKSLHVVSTSEQLRLAYDSTNTVYSDFRNDSAGGLLINTTGGYIINYIGGTERMRISDNCSVVIRGSFGICNGGAINLTIPNNLNGGSIRMVCCTGANQGDMYLTGGGGGGILIAGSGRVSIGTTTPCTALDIRGSEEGLYIARIAGGVDYGPHVRMQKARGSVASPTIVSNGDTLGSLTFEAYYGSGYSEAAGIRGVVNGAVSSGVTPTDLLFAAGINGTTAQNERMRIKSNGLILACGRMSSILANVGNVQEWVGQTGAVSNNTGWSLFSIANQYDILSMDIYVFTNVGSYQASKHEAVFGYTASTWSGIGFGSAFCIFRTGTTFNETMTICNLSGSNINDQKIAIRVWGYGVGQDGTGGTNLLNTSCLTRIK